MRPVKGRAEGKVMRRQEVEFTRPHRRSRLPSRPCAPSCVGAGWKPLRSDARNPQHRMQMLQTTS